MTVNENGNTAREDGTTPVPPNPEVVDPPPPEETERMNLDGDTSGTTPPGSNHGERNKPMTDNTKWIPVMRDGHVQQERRLKAAENTITGSVAPPPDTNEQRSSSANSTLQGRHDDGYARRTRSDSLV